MSESEAQTGSGRVDDSTDLVGHVSDGFDHVVRQVEDGAGHGSDGLRYHRLAEVHILLCGYFIA